MKFELPPLSCYAQEPVFNDCPLDINRVDDEINGTDEQTSPQTNPSSLQVLQNSAWLAQRLSVSISAINKARVYQPDTIPPHINIGRTVRYCPNVVEQWIANNMGVNR